MKIVYTTDLHGEIWKYDRLLKAASEFQADAVINGGDMLPKAGNLFDQDKFITGYLEKHLEQAAELGISNLCYMGNDDLRIFDDLFERTCEKYHGVVNLAQRKYDIGTYEFIGMNWVVDYPFRLKDRCRMDTKDYAFQMQFGTGLLSTPDGFEELPDWSATARTLATIEDELEQLPKPKSMSQSIYVIHMPPSRLGLDVCGNASEVGSKAIYNFLETNQPLLSLHGHIHESPETSGIWYANLGKTLCIQPGQLTPFTYVTIDLETMEFERHTEY
ncbi:MAG TPA: phosphoesterase [Nitrospiraceae bacterium]|nr:phosphoesterase [Nitrospiraceae bacterium]